MKISNCSKCPKVNSLIILWNSIFPGEDFVKAVSSFEKFHEKPVLTTALTDEEYQSILAKASAVDLDAENFLHRSDYIISYSEFLFLLSKYHVNC